MYKEALLAYVSVIIISLFPANGNNGTDLLEYLFNTTRYDKRIRPSFGSSEPVNIAVGLSLLQIEDLDEKRQVLIAHVVMTLEWNEPKLSWNSSKYNGIANLDIPSKNIWFPDIVLYNSVDSDFIKSVRRNNALLHCDGLIKVTYQKILHSSCKTNVANYPFDKQECMFKFGSWAYNGFDLVVISKIGQVDLSRYVKNGEWKLEDMKSTQNKIIYGCCPEPYYDITYYIKLQRQVLYYAMYFIIPCTLIALLAATIFVLPQDCSERITVGMCTLVALSFFFLLVSESMPASSKLPLIGGYYSVTLIQMGVSFFMNILVLRFHNMTDEKMPDWVRTFILGYGATLIRNKIVVKPGSTEDEDNNNCNRELGKDSIMPYGTLKKRHAMEVLNSDQMIVTAIKEDSERSKLDIEWKQAADVLNNLALILHILVVLFTFAVMFFEVLFIAKS